MSTFIITNTTSGHTLGEFEGATELDAYQAMMRDAGYANAEHAASVGLEWHSIPSDLSIRAQSTISYSEVKNLYPKTSARDSLEAAVADGWTICHYETPLEAARVGITVDEAIEIKREDASLIYLTR